MSCLAILWNSSWMRRGASAIWDFFRASGHLGFKPSISIDFSPRPFFCQDVTIYIPLQTSGSRPRLYIEPYTRNCGPNFSDIFATLQGDKRAIIYSTGPLCIIATWTTIQTNTLFPASKRRLPRRTSRLHNYKHSISWISTWIVGCRQQFILM
ncbi:hypothetical protein BofuT4_P005970.1 [Botrytis cinerea T4]|uniref:Uncharacterized protein n=1 Tax=Botryotinia fuckeliana (strain T4) TaxID=999810 RepID=G2Y448_BOTF4|nr:hypothetical protein BofuT4_P005970.1 [Botrytis cinerea T4]